MQRTINGWVWLSDIAVLLAFAAIGRQNHGESSPISAIISTALPFILAWSLVGWASKQIQPRPRWQWMWQSALANLLACALGLGMRALWLQRGIPLSFAVVAFAVTTFFLSMVRLAHSFRITPLAK